MVAPFYGTSLYVWASVLAVTLGGLTTGYFLGGWATYRYPVVKMLIGVLLVPIFGVMSGFAPGRLENFFAFWAALTAIICFVGGPLRMLFAAIFEEGAPKYPFPMAPTYNMPSIPPANRTPVLPPASVNPASQWRQRPQTAEILQPPSVTDSTTRLLDKEPKSE